MTSNSDEATVGLDPRISSRLVRARNGCLEWSGYRNRLGYGVVGLDCKRHYVHRLTYEAALGPIPDGYEIDHLCRNPPCAEPEHLQAVPHRVNMLRGNTVVARNSAARTCKNGHALVGENVYRWRGHRACRMCRREAMDRFHAKAGA